MADVVDDGVDVAARKKVLVANELDNGFPKVFVFKFITQWTMGDGPGVVPSLLTSF